MKRRDVTEMMVREAQRLGYRALVVTVDAPRLGAPACTARTACSCAGTT
jgi:isopentenyl diphosphate isomerase/L-lactate dehydrogenase-like FMN-dependent dehydrogenase